MVLPGALAFPALSACSDLTLLGGRRGGGLVALGRLRDLFTFPAGASPLSSSGAGGSASGTGASGTDRPGCVLIMS
jgi:hypothetical protein